MLPLATDDGWLTNNEEVELAFNLLVECPNPQLLLKGEIPSQAFSAQVTVRVIVNDRAVAQKQFEPGFIEWTTSLNIASVAEPGEQRTRIKLLTDRAFSFHDLDPNSSDHRLLTIRLA